MAVPPFFPPRSRLLHIQTRLPPGLSQGQRKILSKGLVSNGATLLDFSPGDGNVSSPATLMPNASQILMAAAKSSSKRKRVDEGWRSKKGKGVAGGGGGGGGGVSTKVGRTFFIHIGYID